MTELATHMYHSSLSHTIVIQSYQTAHYPPARPHQSAHYNAVLVVLPTIVYIIYFSCHPGHHVHWRTIHRTKPAKGGLAQAQGTVLSPERLAAEGASDDVLHPEYRWTLAEMSTAVNSFVSQHMQPIIILAIYSLHLFDVPVVRGIPDARLWGERPHN